MYGILGTLVVILGVPLCAIVVISGVLEYPYLIVIPVGTAWLIRRWYRGAKKRFEEDVAMARLHNG